MINLDRMKSSSDIDQILPNLKSPLIFEELVSQFFENDSITIPLLAKKMSISVSTLERLVKSKYGITPKQFITDYRLTKAEVLLRQDYKNIKQLAAETGFNSVAYFCYCFKKKFGKPPKAYCAFMQYK